MEFDDHLTCSWSAVELINRLCCYCSVDCFLGDMNSKSRWNTSYSN
ncbi:hypothetical protein HanIR_Chr16g0788861 [Helianthus annuus]|nr:hypothetical protein HanIR_Chr16g0788861 [Helianthus annuus]